MRKSVCPQCKEGIFCVMNEAGERLTVYVSADHKVVAKDPSASLEGFNLEVVYCLVCSWKGSPKKTTSLHS